jgi:hypothetical protein
MSPPAAVLRARSPPRPSGPQERPARSTKRAKWQAQAHNYISPTKGEDYASTTGGMAGWQFQPLQPLPPPLLAVPPPAVHTLPPPSQPLPTSPLQHRVSMPDAAGH